MKLKTFLVVSSCLLGFTVGERNQQDRRVSELEDQLKSVRNELDELRRNINAHVPSSQKHDFKSSDIPHNQQARNDAPTGIGKFDRVYRSTLADQVAFTAALGYKVENLALGATIVFNKIVYSTVSSYDNVTGVFTCPLSGLYLFSIFVQSSTHKEAAVKLMMDGTQFSSAVSEPSRDDEDDTGGNLVLLFVNEGSRVWVETFFDDNQSLWPARTTFSGVLIHRANAK